MYLVILCIVNTNTKNHNTWRSLWSDLQLHVQSIPVTTKVVSSNPVHGEVYSTALCDKVCQWLARGRWLSPGIPVSSTNKADRHNITEILLKVALNTIHQTKPNKPNTWLVFNAVLWIFVTIV
jgi:hypothetical protein